MGPEGHFRYNTLDMSWDPVPNCESYSIVVEKCDTTDESGYDICHQIFSENVKNTTKLVQTSNSFADCTTYQLKVKM